MKTDRFARGGAVAGERLVGLDGIGDPGNVGPSFDQALGGRLDAGHGPGVSLVEPLHLQEVILADVFRVGVRKQFIQVGLLGHERLVYPRRGRLAAIATARLGIPVSIDNDANLIAMAELWFGAGRQLSDFAVVTIEHGVGMGFVMNHRIYRGAQRVGMELGHTKVQLDGALCRCGQRGCLEAYVADYALAREATTALNWSHREGQSINVLLESLYDHAKAGNTAARSIFRRAGRYLAVGLSNVVNLFDPSLIILSGERMRYDYLYASETLAEMEQLAISTGRPKPPVKIHAWGDLLWAHGAAALALSEVTDALLMPARESAA